MGNAPPNNPPRSPLKFLALAGSILTLAYCASRSGPTTPVRDTELAARIQAEQHARNERWAADKPRVLEEARAALTSGDTARAVDLLAGRLDMGDLDVTALHRDALLTHERRKLLAAPKGDLPAQIAAMRIIHRLDPADATVAKALPIAEKRLADKTAAADRARRRKEGVSVGMTADEVLMSSWGRPESRNISTSATSTREQWVYGSGNYLYFRNGILETIHTAR